MSLLKKIKKLLHSLSLYNVLGFLFLFFIGLNLFISLKGSYLGFLLGFVISFLISFFVLDKFNYSEYVIISLSQKTLYLTILIILGIFIYFLIGHYF